jgi:anti-anti-sigma factor
MKITHDRDRLRIAAIGPLGADHAVRFRREVQAALTSQVAVIEIDLAGTDWIDSSGLAMLCGLHRSAGDLGISLLLLHPQPAVRQLLALTQTDQLLGLDQAEPQWPGTPRPAITRFAAVPAH